MELGEIQGNILAPFNKPHQLFMFLNFEHNQAGARAWLGRLLKDKRFATTEKVAPYNEELRKLKPKLGPRPVEVRPELATTWMGVGLTSWGLVTLHPELAPDLVAYEAFWGGPLAEGTDEKGNRTAPAAMLGDPEQSDPKRWVIGGPAQRPVDALVTIAGDDRAALEKQAKEERRVAEEEFELRVLTVEQGDGTTPAWQLGARLEREGIGGVEHFGFKDGISQPSIRDFTSPTTPEKKRWESADRPGSPVIATGEFILGYPGERGSYLRGPSAGPARVDVGWVVPALPSPEPGRRRLVGGDGRLGEQLSMDAEAVAAKVIGRQRDGTPLAPKGGGAEQNDFDFCDDRVGEHTPRFAHIRRHNSREDVVYNDRSHRLLRRGIPFGGPLAATLDEARKTRDVERGLLLNAFMADLDDQFVFVQRSGRATPGNFP